MNLARTETNIESTAEQSQRRTGSSQRWLYLFYIVIVFSAVVKTITYLGDERMEKGAKANFEFNDRWLAWRSTEDSIRSSLDLIGFQHTTGQLIAESVQTELEYRKHIERIRRSIKALQSFPVPSTASSECGPIYASLAGLSESIDTLDGLPSLASLSNGRKSDSLFINIEGRWERNFHACIAAINAIRSERMAIVGRNTDRFNQQLEEWQATEGAINAVSLVVVAFLAIFGLVLARNLSNAERDRTRQFAMLTESENRYRAVVDNIPGVIFRSRIAEDWPVEYISDNVERITGYPASDFVNNNVRRFGSIIHPADVDKMTSVVDAALKNGTPYSLEYRIINASGEIVWLSERGRVAVDSKGKPTWLDGAIFDITARKKAVDNLAESEETLRAMIDASPGVALLLDSDGRVLAVNNALAKSVGLRREELLGKLGYEIVPKELVHESWMHFRKTVETGQKCDFVQSFEGNYTHVYFRPILDGRGRVVRVAIFGMDVSSWKTALNESRRFKNLFDQTTDIVAIINPNYDYLYMNRACSEFVGDTASHPITKLDIGKHYTPESVELIRNVAFPTVIRDGIWQGEATLLNYQGKEIPASLVFTAHRNAEGELEHLSCIIRDLTDRKRVELELAEVNNRLHEMLNAIPLPVYYKDRDLRYQGCNSAFERYFEIKEVEFIGKSVYEVFPNSECDRISASDRELMEHQIEIVEEGAIPTANGEIVNILLHKAPVRKLDGSCAGLVAVGIDITERKKMEEALRQSANQLRQLTAGLPGVIYQCCIGADRSLNFTFISDSAINVFGQAPETITADPAIIFSAIHPDDVGGIYQLLVDYRVPDNYWYHEFRCIVRDEERWIRGSALLQSRENGVAIWNGMLVDITEQRQIAEELRISEERFRRLFDSAGFGIAGTDHTGTIGETNPAFQRMLQYSADELRGMTWASITHPGDVEMGASLVADAHEVSSSGVHFEKRYIRKNGETIWARLSVVEIPGDQGEPSQFFGIAEDVTERRRNEERIRESEALYRTLFESSGEGLYLIADFYVDCNERGAEMFGCRRSEIVGLTPVDYSPEFQPDGRLSEEAAREYLAAAETGHEQSFTWRHLRTDGREIDTEVTLKRLSISGNVIVLASVRDVSERIRMESALRDSLMQLNTLVSSAVDGIVLTDHDGYIESANPAATKIFETSEQELIATNIVNLVAEPHRSRYLDLLQQSDSDSASMLLRGVHEVLGLRTGDYVFPMDIAISPLQLGDTVKYVAILRDISGRKFAEQRIVENEARLEAILSSAGDGIIVIDGDRNVQIFNDAAQSVFGRPASEVIGRRFEELVPGFSERSLPTKGERLSFETVGSHSDQGDFPLQLSVSRVFVGGSESYSIIARNLTEDYDRRERMMEADKLTSIGTLAAGIAHEFKNYLAGIIGNASFAMDCLQEPDGMEEAREAFEQIIAIGEKANEIALSLLTYSRQRQNDLELIDLWEVIQSTLRFTGKELAEKRVEIVTHFEELPKVMVSANRAQQLFLNLIINASQAITDGGVITISASRTESTVTIKIGDTGAGISPENMRRIFDPFFSTKGVWGKDAVHGTGLGLSICKNIINSFGGEITVESSLGKGTTFSVTLPIPDQNSIAVANSQHLHSTPTS